MTQILPTQIESTETYESLFMYRTLDDSNPAVSDRKLQKPMSLCLCIGRWMTQMLPSQTESTETYESLSMYRTLDDSNPAVSDRKQSSLLESTKLMSLCLCIGRWMTQNPADSDRKHRNL